MRRASVSPACTLVCLLAVHCQHSKSITEEPAPTTHPGTPVVDASATPGPATASVVGADPSASADAAATAAPVPSVIRPMLRGGSFPHERPRDERVRKVPPSP